MVVRAERRESEREEKEKVVKAGRLSKVVHFRIALISVIDLRDGRC